MKFTKHLKMRGLYLVGLCLLSVFAFGGVAGSASAASLLFRPENGTFPYLLAGSSGASKLETVGTKTVTSTQAHFASRVLSATETDVEILFLGVKSAGEPCGNQTNAKSEKILTSLEGHIGLAHSGDVPAVLLLLPSGGFEFKCSVLGGLAEVPIKVRGSVIGKIASPAVGVASESLLLSFKQSGGKQEFTTFLKGNEILTNQFEETSINGAAFEQSGQEGHGTQKAVAGSGTFLLITP